MRTASDRPFVLAPLLGLVLAACAGGRDQERRDIAEIGRIHDEQQAAFLAGQAEFQTRHPMPIRREVPGIGTLVVHEAGLGGRLGLETLHLLFTWVNDTGQVTPGARVRVTLKDAGGKVEREQRVDLRSLLGVGFTPDSTYTSFVDLPTEGLHLRPGWDWTIELEPLPSTLYGVR